jgi:hypothetical protein
MRRNLMMAVAFFFSASAGAVFGQYTLGDVLVLCSLGKTLTETHEACLVFPSEVKSFAVALEMRGENFISAEASGATSETAKAERANQLRYALEPLSRAFRDVTATIRTPLPEGIDEKKASVGYLSVVTKLRNLIDKYERALARRDERLFRARRESKGYSTLADFLK